MLNARNRWLCTSHENAWSIAREYANGGWRKCTTMRRAPVRDSTYACVHLGALAGCNADDVMRPLGSRREMLRSGGNCDSSDQQ
jgi:hypothetical protein